MSKNNNFTQSNQKQENSLILQVGSTWILGSSLYLPNDGYHDGDGGGDDGDDDGDDVNHTQFFILSPNCFKSLTAWGENLTH